MHSEGDSGHPPEAEDRARRGLHCCEMKSLHTGKGPVVHGSAHRQQEAFLQLFYLLLMRKRRKTCFGGFQAILCLSLW